MKFCKKCKFDKNKCDFSNSEFNKSNGRCKKCIKQHYIDNKEKIKELNKLNYIKNKKERLLKAKEYYINNKEKILKTRQNYVKNNKEKVRQVDKNYYLNNKESVLNTVKIYYIKNKRKLNAKKQSYKKNKRAVNPYFSLKECVSVSIYYYLKNKKCSKKRSSFLKNVSWTLQELITHLENNFENWMNWNNQGIYKKSEWDDNDSSTWKWQLDHITPHSHFNYTSMEDDDFKKCWALENLRPYSAKQNILDGNRRKE